MKRKKYLFVYFDRKEMASPEDIEYFECQQEMMIDLYESHQQLDRIVGEFKHFISSRLYKFDGYIAL